MSGIMTAEIPRGEQKVLAQEWVAADKAAVCMDCECVFRIGKECPRCGSKSWMLLTTILRAGKGGKNGDGIPSGR